MKLLTFVASCMMFLAIACQSEAQPHHGGLNWQTNYEKALEQSKSSSKNVVLFFTASDYCMWCTRLEEEVFNTAEFAQLAGPQFIFVKLDFPMSAPMDPAVSKQNKSIRKKFDVRIFPTIIILDENGRQIGTTGYKPGGAKEYYNHLMKMVNDYRLYQKRVAELGKSSLSSFELQKLYEKAKTLQREGDATAIASLGLEDKNNIYFLKERYRSLAEEGKIDSEEAKNTKEALLKNDPTNAQHIHYDVALIEFETFCSELEKDHYTPETVVAPLVNYIEAFKQQDQDNIWRIQMLISQVFLDNNKLEKALKYAQQSYQAAPTSVKPEIALAIDNIQSQLRRS